MSRKSVKIRSGADFPGSRRRGNRRIDADTKLLAECGELADPELRSLVALFQNDGIHMLQKLVIHVLYAPEIDLEGQRAHQVNRLVETVKRILSRLDSQFIGHAAKTLG